MGKDKVSGNLSKIDGINSLYGAEVMATDLRASVSYFSRFNCKNRTIINRVYHLDRGYENLENKLRKCGANILERITNGKKSLKLNAVSQNDLQVMSAHLQDSITQIKNIAHLKK